MQVLRLLAARRPVSTMTAVVVSASECRDSEDDEGPFFDLDFSSVRGAESSSGSASGTSESEDDDSGACTELDFIISLQRSRSASPSYETLFFGASELPPAEPTLQLRCFRKRGLRALSFGARKAAFYGGRRSFARSSSSARSLRLFMESPHADEEEEAVEHRRAPSGDVIRRYLTKISRRFRAAGPRAPAEARGLRKSRSASAAVPASSTAAPSRRDDSLVEKQDGIAGAIAHCKESLHRASMSECDSPLLRSRSDPGKCEAA